VYESAIIVVTVQTISGISDECGWRGGKGRGQRKSFSEIVRRGGYVYFGFVKGNCPVER